MDIEKLRLEIIRQIEETEDMELLFRIKDAIADYEMINEPSVQYGVESDEDIVAYTVDGRPLTKAEYIADIKWRHKRLKKVKAFQMNSLKLKCKNG